jgi:uncharacterized RDD family membrane protein YckC
MNSDSSTGVNEPARFTLASASQQHRLGGFFLEIGLIMASFFTLGLAWIIWNLVVWGQGQTPSKQILKMRVYSIDTGRPASWGHMAIRQFLIPMAYSMVYVPFALIAFSLAIDSADDYTISGIAVLGYLSYFILILLDALWIFKGNENKRLTDSWARTFVVNEAA